MNVKTRKDLENQIRKNYDVANAMDFLSMAHGSISWR